MPKFKVEVIFDRKNPTTGEIEKKTVRESEFWADTAKLAKQAYLKRFRENEPTRRKIHKVEVTKLEE